MPDHHVLTEGSLPPSADPLDAFPSFPTPAASLRLALLAQLAETQWWPAERVRARQLEQLDLLVRHAATTTRYGRQAFRGYATHPLDWDAWSRLPVLTRRMVQAKRRALISEAVPDDHGTWAAAKTSGATGTPVVVERTWLGAVMWDVITARDNLWHRRDTSLGLAAVRDAPGSDYPTGARGESWGGSARLIGPAGPARVLHVSATTEQQLEWLARAPFAYLMIYPSALRDLVRLAVARGVRFPALRAVRTLGEVVAPELRALVGEAWGVPIEDLYSSAEVGYIGLQCPDHPHFHVQSESLLLEVLRDDDTPCEVGEVGRVVVTPLHNFAMPLVRYDLGDLGALGPPCPCGRGLPVLERVLGRVRQTFLTATGDRIWLAVGIHRVPELAPVAQHQAVQKAVDHLEVRLVARAPATPAQEQAVRDLFAAALPAGTRVTLAWVDDIPRTATGKFLDFVSEL